MTATLPCSAQAADKYGSEIRSLKQGECGLQLVLLPFGRDKEDLDEYQVIRCSNHRQPPCTRSGIEFSFVPILSDMPSDVVMSAHTLT